MSNWQERCTVENIDQCLAQTTVYITCIPGEEWAIWKLGRYYFIQQHIPKWGEKKRYTNLTELLLWFTIGDAVKRGQYEPMQNGNVVNLSMRRGEK
jgi:hypothetical protein